MSTSRCNRSWRSFLILKMKSKLTKASKVPERKADMKNIALVSLITSILSLCVGAQEKATIKQSMKERFATITKLKAQGIVGEKTNGLVALVDTENASEDASALIQAENTDRKALYQIIAEETETTPNAVAKNNALRIFKKAGGNELFETGDGAWKKKSKLVKK
ncbi:MAG: DUF1318 domain-containing protein [Chitinivibrionales bacterium]|nr:DUF1318 domain-containing protein [Chitinivibrionales bacterium]